MGNFNAQLKWAQEQPERDRAEAQRRADLDKLYPPMARPCGTPGAVYTITVKGRDLGCVVHLPFSIERALPADAKKRMKQALHDALLPIVEQFYRDVWEQTIAGKKLADDPEPMPARWELLFAKWIRRCLNRGEVPIVDGRKIWHESGLPNAYRADR
jgi:hypothetical protein